MVLLVVIVIVLMVTATMGVAAWSRRVITDPSYYARQMSRAYAAPSIESARKRYHGIIDQLGRVSAPARDLLITKGEAWLALGNSEQRASNVPEALAAYREAAKLIEPPPDVVDLIAGDYAQGGVWSNEAIDAYVLLLQLFPIGGSARHDVLAILQERTRLEATATRDEASAVARLSERILHADPTLEWAVLVRAAALDRLQEPRAAIAILRDADRVFQTSAAIAFQLGVLQRKVQDNAAAYIAFQQALQRGTMRWEARYELAAILGAKARSDGDRAHSTVTEAVEFAKQACEKAPQQSETWALLGSLELQRNEPAAALLAVQRAAVLQPTVLAAQMTVADVALAANSPEVAIVALGRALLLDSKHLQANLLLAELLLARNATSDAAPHFRAVLAQQPAHDAAREGLGRCLFSQQAWRESVGELQQVRALTKEGRYALARALARLGEPAPAIVHYRTIVEKHGADPELGYHLGSAYGQAGDWPAALSSFTEATSIGDSTPVLQAHLRFGRGTALLHLGRFDEARAALEGALELAPGNAQVLYALGTLANACNDSDSALAAFTQALVLEPSMAAAQFGLGLLHERASRWIEASAAYGAGLILRPDWLPAKLRLGVMQCKCNMWPEALANLEAAREAGMECEQLSFSLGLTRAVAGRWALALATWEPLLAQHPNIEQLADNISKALFADGRDLFQRGDYDGAIRQWSRSLELRPTVEEFRGALVAALIRRVVSTVFSDDASAATRAAAGPYLERALALAPDEPSAKYLQGLLHLAGGNAPGAIHLLEALTSEYPANTSYRYHLALAYLETGLSGAAGPLLEALPVRDSPYAIGLQLAKGNAALMEGRWIDAVNAFGSLE